MSDDVLGYTQTGYAFSVSTPFGGDTLLLMTFDIIEQLSRPFELHLVMRSESATLDFSQIVGQAVTLTSTVESGAGTNYTNYYHGIVARFRQDGLIYTAEVRPAFGLLNLASDNRIFQGKTVPDIVTALLSENSITDVRNALTGTYSARDYCVQYNETTFDFISRLLEEEGIFYFFEHYAAKHVFVLADTLTTAPNCVNVSVGEFKPEVGHTRFESDSVLACGTEQAVVAQAFQSTDYDFTSPSSSLVCKVAGPTSPYQLYEYPGLYLTANDGATRVKTRLDEAQSFAQTVWAETVIPALRTGHQFSLTGHPQTSLNTDYVLYSITHHGRSNEYRNSIMAFPATATFRPPRTTPKPRIHGSQTAVVVGQSGKEIWTDQYGRIKVQFYWDLRGVNDENSSCWIRVAQGWAGKNWGSMWLPRIGQEVVVAFLDGDPDRPLVVGSVYNSTQQVPYALPDQQTKSTIKSNSSMGGNGFNEIRFEDKAGSEEVFMQAQKDMNVTVTNDLAWTVNHSETATISQDRTATVSKGNDSLTVSQGNRTVTISQGNDSLTISQGTRTVSVAGADSHTSKNGFTHNVTGDCTLKVSGNLTIQATGSITIKAGTSLELDAGTSITLKAGTSLTGNAGTSLSLAGTASAELKSDATATVQGSAMLTLKGGVVQIN